MSVLKTNAYTMNISTLFVLWLQAAEHAQSRGLCDGDL